MPVTPPSGVAPADSGDADFDALARTHASNPNLVRRLHAEIAANGPITLARFMSIALYDPADGYYTTATRRPGRGGDFLTSPETHPYFGFTIARQIAECWERLGRPDPFTIREYGPGMGTLAYDILVALTTEVPDLAAVVRYRLCDLNTHRLAEALAAMDEVGFGPIVACETPEEAASSPITGVVLANEVADALPCHQVVVRNGALRERFITWDDAAAWFAWTEGDRSPELATLEATLRAEGVEVEALPEWALLECCPAAATWIAEVAAGIARGYAFIIDYGYPAPELYAGHRLAGLLRGYREHTVTDDVLTAIGAQDLTAHVDFSHLIDAATSAGGEMTLAGLTTQGDALAALGLGDYLVALQQQPEATLEEYYQAQLAVMRLIDPGGLGRFRVLGLAKGAPVRPNLRAFSAS